MKSVLSTVAKNSSHRSSRKGGTVFACLLPALAFLAFAVRFLVSCQLIAADPAASAPSIITDMRTYLDMADKILAGNIPEQFYYQPFYYAVFLPICRFLRPSPYILALIQSLLGAATVYLAGVSAQKISGRRSGLWSAALCCFCAIHIYFTPYALLELLQGFWITLLFYLSLDLCKKNTPLRWGIWGFILGCSILTRGNTWCFLPLPVLGLFALHGKREWRRILANILLMVFCAFLPQFPFMIHNSIHLKHLSGPSTAGNAVLAIGNNPEGAPAGLDLPYPKTYELWMAKEKEISIPKRMIRWMLDEPAAFWEQQFQKFFLFWDSMEYPNNISEYNANKSSIMNTFHFLPTGIIVLLGLGGIFSGLYLHLFRNRLGFALLTGFILLYSCSIIAFYILARFRLPILPLLCVSGGFFIEILIRTANKIRLRLFGFGALACFIVYGFAPLYMFAYEPFIASWTRPDGVQTLFEAPPYPWKNAPRDEHFLMSTDHTSVVKNGWSALGSDLKVKKLFALKQKPSTKRGLLVLAAPGQGGSVILTVNGERQFVQLQDQRILAEIPLIYKNGFVSVDIELTNAQGNWTLAGDVLRNYGRTLINDKVVPYELAAWLIVPVKPEGK